MGLMNMLPEKRLMIYQPFIDYFKEHDTSYSISDNDLRYLGNNRCCCGDMLVSKASGFDTTALCMKYGKHWSLQQALNEVGDYQQCKACDLVASNRVYGCKTVADFYRKRFLEPTAPLSPRYMYIHQPSLFDIW